MDTALHARTVELVMPPEGQSRGTGTTLPPEVRAEVLRVGHMLTMGAPVLDPQRYAHVPGGTLELRDLIVLSGAGVDDLALLNACLDAERDLREQEFAALEALLTLAQFSEGPLDDRLAALPVPDFALAVYSLLVLGWAGDTAGEKGR